MAPFPPCESLETCCQPNEVCMRQEWPELLGVAEKEACLAIEKSNTKVRAVPLLLNEIHTTDFCCNRVWVFVDKHGGVVIQAPMVGWVEYKGCKMSK